jgi:acyl-CoA reductase-like NAD-dependent aldehyde dehydrogenase
MAKELIEKKVFIGGEWVESESRERMEVRYPGDGKVFGTVPKCTRKDAQKAIEAAIEGQKAMAKLSVMARVNLMYKALEIAKRRTEEASRILCMEVGKTIREARDEVGVFSWSHFTEAAEGIKRHRGLTCPSTQEDSKDKRIIITHEPIGVVVVISPYNWPSDIPNIAIPHALAVGDSVIMKPASTTPFSNIILCEILEEAGFPPGSVNVVTGPGATVGDELVSNPGTNAIHFTGETKTGEELTRRAGIKRLLLELGGNGPLVVMDDANIDAAVEGTILGCYYLAGQVCTASERILVHKDVHKEFVKKLVDRTKQVKMRDPLDEEADMGPINNEQVLKKVMAHYEDARKKGGKFLIGGGNPKGLFVEPTVIDGVTQDMLVAREETFGPVAPIITFNTIDEAVEIANSTPYGLQAAAFTSSLKKAFYLGENIKAGAVNINESNNYWDQMASFGGCKKSGLGRELSTWILDELTEQKQILFDIAKVRD